MAADQPDGIAEQVGLKSGVAGQHEDIVLAQLRIGDPAPVKVARPEIGWPHELEEQPMVQHQPQPLAIGVIGHGDESPRSLRIPPGSAPCCLRATRRSGGRARSRRRPAPPAPAPGTGRARGVTGTRRAAAISKNSSIQLAVPEMLVTGRSRARGASACILPPQSAIRPIRSGGSSLPCAQPGRSTAAIASLDARSEPLQRRAAGQQHAGPPSTRLCGRAARCQASTSSAARRFDRSMASLQGIRLVAAAVVPEELAR